MLSSRKIHKIVITGGPAAGKTTALERLPKDLAEFGWTVLCVPETPTELITGGVAPWTIRTYYEYQILQMDLHRKQEEVFDTAAEILSSDAGDQILIICDRGQFDCRAYMSDMEWKSALETLNIDEDELRDSYEAVFHLQSVAVDYPDLYHPDTNLSRCEPVDEAQLVESRTVKAWDDHPNRIMIPDSIEFEYKYQKLLGEICLFLEKCK